MSGSVSLIGADAEEEVVVEDDWADKPKLSRSQAVLSYGDCEWWMSSSPRDRVCA